MADPFADLPRNQGQFKPRHGMHGTPTYHSWQSMIARCRRHPRYAAKGIVVCQRWQTFENFLADMGERPEGKSLDRYPNGTGNYEPGNCRWATMQEQQRNRGNNRIINGKCLAEWTEGAAVSKKTVHRRLALGWPIERAIAEPDGRRR